jgi:nucleotide-binding universal stress UspA family protein
MAVFQRVLVASDFSEASARALDLAVAIARDAGAALDVVHVCEIPTYGDFASIDFLTPLTEAAERRIGDLVASLRSACPATKGLVRIGTAWEQILFTAAEVGADLIVLGTHGRRGVSHALLGSIAERVVRLSEIPVLTVRARPAAARGAR